MPASLRRVAIRPTAFFLHTEDTHHCCPHFLGTHPFAFAHDSHIFYLLAHRLSFDSPVFEWLAFDGSWRWERCFALVSRQSVGASIGGPNSCSACASRSWRRITVPPPSRFISSRADVRQLLTASSVGMQRTACSLYQFPVRDRRLGTGSAVLRDGLRCRTPRVQRARGAYVGAGQEQRSSEMACWAPRPG